MKSSLLDWGARPDAMLEPLARKQRFMTTENYFQSPSYCTVLMPGTLHSIPSYCYLQDILTYLCVAQSYTEVLTCRTTKASDNLKLV